MPFLRPLDYRADAPPPLLPNGPSRHVPAGDSALRKVRPPGGVRSPQRDPTVSPGADLLKGREGGRAERKGRRVKEPLPPSSFVDLPPFFRSD